MIVAWTGHRTDLFRDPTAARAAVESVARELIEREQIERMLVGGQRGVDTWAAQAAAAQGVPFTLILPLEPEQFSSDWSAEDRAHLEHSLGLADAVEIVGGDDVAAAYTERNRRLATQADLLVAVWTGIASGGTAETVALARAAGTPIHDVRLEPAAGAARARGRGI